MPLNELPISKKKDTAYIIQSENICRPTNKKRSFWCNMGPWDPITKSQTTENFKIENGLYFTSDIQNSMLTLHRYYTTCKRFKEYKRRISWITNMKNLTPKIDNIVVWEYIGNIPTMPALHGNSRRTSNEFVTTHPDVLNQIKEKVKTKTVYQTYHEMNRNKDTHKNVRDKKQVENVKANQARLFRENMNCANVADSFNIILSMASLVNTDYEIKAGIHKGKPFAIFVLNDAMNDLQKIVRADNKHAPIIGIDTTYNVSNYFLTMTAYQNPYIVQKHRKLNEENIRYF